MPWSNWGCRGSPKLEKWLNSFHFRSLEYLKTFSRVVRALFARLFARFAEHSASDARNARLRAILRALWHLTSEMVITSCIHFQMTNGLLSWKLDSKGFNLIGSSSHNFLYNERYYRSKWGLVRTHLQLSSIMKFPTSKVPVSHPKSSRGPRDLNQKYQYIL